MSGVPRSGEANMYSAYGPSHQSENFHYHNHAAKESGESDNLHFYRQSQKQQHQNRSPYGMTSGGVSPSTAAGAAALGLSGSKDSDSGGGSAAEAAIGKSGHASKKSPGIFGGASDPYAALLAHDKESLKASRGG